MSRSGTYDLIGKKDTSFRSFILIFLGVLLVLVVIYLIMAYGVRSHNKESGISEKILRVSKTHQTTGDTATPEHSDDLQQNIPTNDETTTNKLATDDSENLSTTSSSRNKNDSAAILTNSLDETTRPSPETTKTSHTRITKKYFELQSTTDGNEKLVTRKSISNSSDDSPSTTIESMNSRADQQQYTVSSTLLQNLYSEETGGSDKLTSTIPVTTNGDTYTQVKDYYKQQTTTETKELIKTSKSISKTTENISTTSPGTTIPVESMSSPSDQQFTVSNNPAEHLYGKEAGGIDKLSSTTPYTTRTFESTHSPADQEQYTVSSTLLQNLYSEETGGSDELTSTIPVTTNGDTYTQVKDYYEQQTTTDTKELIKTSKSISKTTENISTTSLGTTIPVESMSSPSDQQLTVSNNPAEHLYGKEAGGIDKLSSTTPYTTRTFESMSSRADQEQYTVSRTLLQNLYSEETGGSDKLTSTIPVTTNGDTYTQVKDYYEQQTTTDTKELIKTSKSISKTTENISTTSLGTTIPVESMSSPSDQQLTVSNNPAEHLYGKEAGGIDKLSSTTPYTTRIFESMSSRADQEEQAASTVPSRDLYTSSYGTTPAEDRTCRAPICKKTSAMWLAMMNYRGSSNACEDFYDFACGESNIFRIIDSYIHSTSKALIAQIEGGKKKSKYSQIFSDFYKYCKTYRDEFLLKDALNSLTSIEDKSLTDIFIRLLLTQSMPFFDIGLKVADNQSLAYELTLPDLSSLRTSLPGWSLMERMKKQCIEEITVKMRGNEIFVDDSVESIHKCVKNDTRTYITNFIEEMKLIEDMSKLSNIKSLVNSFTNHAHDLQVLMDVLQDQLLVNFNSSIHTSKNDDGNIKTISVKELNDQFKLQDLNWTQVFKGISRDVENIEETRVDVYFPAYMTTVVGEFDKNQKISSILNLWHNIQLYRNTRFGSNYEHRNTHCIELASQLMPEISVSHIHDISSNQTLPRSERYELAKSLFQQLKERLRTSLSENMTENSVEIFHDRLDEIHLSNSSVTKNISFSYAYGKDFDLNNKTYSYHQKLMILLRNYRMNVYSLVGRNYSDNFAEILLSYFVDPFETKPHSFPPFRDIVFHPGFLHGISPKLPKYIELATKGFHLSKEIVKHFEKNDFDHELQGDEGTIYDQLKYGSETAELNLIGGVEYTFDNETYKVNQKRCIGKCLNSYSMFEDNAAFRLVTDTLTNVLENTTFLPFMDKTLPAVQKTFVTFIAHEFCERHTLEDFMSDYYGGMELPAPVKLKNMVSNSAFFDELYGCTPKRAFTYQFPYIPQSDSMPMNN